MVATGGLGACWRYDSSMQLAEPIASSWKARLSLGFACLDGRTVLSERDHDGPLVVQKLLYPEGGAVCHAIVVHPPGGIAGDDELTLQARTGEGAAALLTTPGAAKWYRSAGPRAKQSAAFDARGSYRSSLQVRRDGRLLWLEPGRIDGGGRLLDSPAGLGGNLVFGTLFASFPVFDRKILENLRERKPVAGRGSVTLLPGILLARYLGDSSEAARRYFTALWRILRPALTGRKAAEPRIQRT